MIKLQVEIQMKGCIRFLSGKVTFLKMNQVLLT